MTHIKLLGVICKHRSVIDDAYNNSVVNDIPVELIESGIFRKIGKRYELSDSYTQFANTMLKRIDANYIFGDYAEEQKLLSECKKDYLEKGDKEYLRRIIPLIKKLYMRLSDRDSAINIKVTNIISDNDLSIDVVIKDAEDIDSRIEELVKANVKIHKLLSSELRGLSDEIDELLTEIGIDMYFYAENIHSYTKRLNDFILRTRKRKEQNNKLKSLLNKIFNEKDEELKAILISNSQNYHHTIKNGKKNTAYLPRNTYFRKENFINALRNSLEIKAIENNTAKNIVYKKSEPVIVISVNYERLFKDMKKNAPEDIFSFVSKHEEILKYEEKEQILSQAFKAYITIVLENRDNIILSKNYNNNVRIAKWI